MTDDQYIYFMASLGFGFGSMFWPFFLWLLFKAR